MTLVHRALGDSWTQPPGPCLLGEGPVWSVADQCLFWVDIEGRMVHRWQWATEQVRSWPMPCMVGALAIRQQGGLVLALQNGIHLMDLSTGDLTFVLDPEGDVPGTRYNDGTVDPSGRFWIGGMVLDGEPASARLYRIESDGRATTMLTGIGCGNGAGFSPDGKVMYYTDSATRTIRAFDFDVTTGEMKNPVDFVVDHDCTPDGLAVDAEGFVWGVKWGGARLVRYAPDGTIDRVIPLPVPQPTSIAFGGPDLRTMFVTTARTGLSAEELAAAPLSGRVLVIDDVGVTGRADPLTSL
jgi:L-arabinonolactonase